MIYLDNFIKSLKMCWIKRMVEAENDAILNYRIYIHNFRSFGGNFCLSVISQKMMFVDILKLFF